MLQEIQSLGVIVNQLFFNLSTNPFFVGCSVIFMNIGSRFVFSEITQRQANFFNSKIVKYIVLFCMFFITTRDIYSSFILSFVFFSTLFGIFNENSKFYFLTPFSKLRMYLKLKLIENAKNS